MESMGNMGVFYYIQYGDPFFRQGEIIENFYELKLRTQQGQPIDENEGAKVDPVVHPYAIITSQDCDLQWDYRARLGEISPDKMLTHLLCCALFTQDEIRERSNLNNTLWRRVSQNQDERYHYLNEAPIYSLTEIQNKSSANIVENKANIVPDPENVIPELIADFKTAFSLPIEFAYWLISIKEATRRGALFSPFLEDFMHRHFTFLGRVATP